MMKLPGLPAKMLYLKIEIWEIEVEKILINTFILLSKAKYTQEYSNDVSVKLIYHGLFLKYASPVDLKVYFK